MKKIFAICAVATLALCACAQSPYKLIAPMAAEDNGSIAYLFNFDTGQKVDSVMIADANAVFKGEIDEPIVARLICNGNRMGTFILESGTAAVNPAQRRAVGTMLNDMLNAYNDSVESIIDRYNQAETEAEAESVLNAYKAYTLQTIEDNIDNPIGYYVFVDYSNMMDGEDVMAFINSHPSLQEYNRVKNLLESSKRKIATSAGNKFVDFEIEYDGMVKRLSDYVGKGKYVLVDFWASWCGPCMKEIETLKDIYSKYPADKLEVLGVAVWDDPEDSKGAIARKKIPWECILNGQTIPTDAYGIAGIPCIILFDPEGKIVFRDLQGEELKNAISKLF